MTSQSGLPKTPRGRKGWKRDSNGKPNNSATNLSPSNPRLHNELLQRTGVPWKLCRRHGLICPLLTSAPRSGCLAAASVAEATRSRSPGVSSIAFCAQSPDLRSAYLMDMGFAVSCPLALRSRLVSGSCPSTRAFAPRFLQTPPHGGSPCVIANPYLHQVGWRTFTSKLLNMPGAQPSRWRDELCGVG